MIIIGYQGIGKSSVTSQHPEKKRIDLESSNFWYDGKRHEDWYIYYCQIALDLSSQGYTVFTSSHKEVREFLSKQDKEICYVIYPDIKIKDEWIKKLEDRYEKIHTEKNYKALMNAKDRYEETIKELSCHMGNLRYRMINDVKYDLDSIITAIEKANKLARR